jgi:glycine betaine catabolism B
MPFETNVIEIIQRTPDVMSIRFEKPQGFSYRAGQYVIVTLVVTPDNSPDRMKKPFTLSSSPTEDFLEITKKLTGHPFSNALAALRPGDKFSINGPFGEFTFQGECDNVGMLSDREHIFFTCGPMKMVESMISLLKEMEIPAGQIKKENFPGDF